MEQQKMSRKELNAQRRAEEAARIQKEREDALKASQQIIRRYTLRQVAEKVQTAIEKFKLSTKLEKEFDHSIRIVVLTPSYNVELGFTTVTKSMDGSYIVAGTMAGCFMAESPSALKNMLKHEFKALEENANEEAPKIYKSDVLNRLHHAETYAEREAIMGGLSLSDVLAEEFGMKGHPKHDMLFSKAWDDGHSSGYYSVVQEYQNLVELVK